MTDELHTLANLSQGKCCSYKLMRGSGR